MGDANPSEDEVKRRYGDMLSVRLTAIGKLNSWITAIHSNILRFGGSLAWTIGDVIGGIAESVGLSPKPPISARDEAELWKQAYERYQSEATGRYSRLAETPHSLDEIKRANSHVSQDVFQLAHWVENLLADFGHMENSRRWEIGRRFAGAHSTAANQISKTQEIRAEFEKWRCEYESACTNLAKPIFNGARSAEDQLDFIVFSIIDWHSRIQRPQHLSLEFGKLGQRVFYIDKTFASAPGEGGYSIIDAPEEMNLIVRLYCPKPWPVISRDEMTDSQCDTMLEGIQSLFADFAIEKPALLLDLPFWMPLTEKIDSRITLYDCMDLHTGFGLENETLKRAEERLLKSADLVIVTAERLVEHVRPHANAVLIRNAADIELFSKKPDKLALHSERRVVGYYGAIASWFDFELVVAAAKANLEWDFVLVGSTGDLDISPLRAVSNIRFIGEVPYAAIPGWLHAFDVCIVPFKVNQLTLHTNPVKVYEYLSAGKPVVATLLPELEAIGAPIHLASSAKEFVEQLKIAMEESASAELKQQRSLWAADHTWTDRARSFIEAIEKTRPRTGASK